MGHWICCCLLGPFGSDTIPIAKAGPSISQAAQRAWDEECPCLLCSSTQLTAGDSKNWKEAVGNPDSCLWTCCALDRKVSRDESQMDLWPLHVGWGQVERFEREAQSIFQSPRGHWHCPLLHLYFAVYSTRLRFGTLTSLLSELVQNEGLWVLYLNFYPFHHSLLHHGCFVFVVSPSVHFWKWHEIWS